MTIVDALTSVDGSVKYIFKTDNGFFCEAIYYRLDPKNGIPYDRYHICISSQSGCKMSCSFCATGKYGFHSNLSYKEMNDEIDLVRHDIITKGLESSNTKYSAVVMGMGEPLDNFVNLEKFCEQITTKNNQLETIPISSVGIVPNISKLADVQNKLKNIKFFISLHSPYDIQRTQMIPINKKYGIEKLLSACKEYSTKTGLKTTLSYMLIDGINDSPRHLEDLVKLTDSSYFKVQLLLYNDSKDCILCRPTNNKAEVFQNALTENGISSVVRVSKGQDINGGCGQFVANYNKSKGR